MDNVAVLAGVAARLNRATGAGAIPALYFLTDPVRVSDPVAIAGRLPAGAAVIYRHFGAANRAAIARTLARTCQARRLFLLIGGDPGLAREVDADGVHWPERALRRLGRRRSGAFRLETAAAHGRGGLARAAAAGLDACLLSPIFASRSDSASALLGALKAGRLARAAGLPVIALGGIGARNCARLIGRGFAGLAAIDGITSA